MTTRTVKILGLAYGSSPTEITVTLDGTEVYSGAVTTLDQPMPTMPDSSLTNTTVEFCSFEIPMDFAGTKSLSCTVTSGTAIFAQIIANYSVIAGSDPVIGVGATEYRNINGTSDPRLNVAINGIPWVINRVAELPGTWWYTVDAGSTLTNDLAILAGTEAVAP